MGTGKGKLSHLSLLLKQPLNQTEVKAVGAGPLPALSILLRASNIQVAWKYAAERSYFGHDGYV